MISAVQHGVGYQKTSVLSSEDRGPVNPNILLSLDPILLQ
jgi:hypothetical protein